MEAVDLLDVLGPWSQGEGPLYRLLEEGLRAAILRGDIASGTRLPAERELAQALAVSRTTVAAAYELLQQDEWVERRRGSGTWVRPVWGNRSSQRTEVVASTRARGPLYDALLRATRPAINMSILVTGDSDQLPREAFTLSEPELAQLLGQPGYTPLGLPALRQAIACQYGEAGLPTSEEQILVTSGAQQAIFLAASLYAQRGDPVLLESPTYVGAIEAFRSTGARLIPVPVEGAGVRVDLLRGLLKANLPRIVYLTPTCQNPTGTVLPERERQEIATIAAEYHVPVLDDTTLEGLVLSGDAPPPLAAFSPEAPIITIGSMSKLFWAGIRIGWVRADTGTIARLARLKLVVDLGSDLVSQAIAARLLMQTNSMRRLRRQELSLRLDLVTRLLSEQLPGWKWERPAGGASLWVRLPCADTREFAQIALRSGVILLPGATMSVDDSHTDFLRLPYALPSDTLREAVARLADAWDAFARMPGVGSQGVSALV